ncbi:hypothetical protein D3C75_860160 [compost metagenome]
MPDQLVQHHAGQLPHLLRIDSHRSQRRGENGCNVNIVEPHNSHLPGNANGIFHQKFYRPQRDHIVSAEDRSVRMIPEMLPVFFHHPVAFLKG